jgi:tetratricopeptide (TPR) repeat protein
MASNKLGEQHQALKLLEEAISTPDLPKPQQAFVLNNAAWLILLNKGDVAKAYDYARQAFGVIPWEPSFEGTLGSTLIEMGDIAQGISHVLRAYQNHPLQQNKATNLAYAAIGYYRLGNQQQAKEYLEKAIAIDVEADIVNDARQEMGI